MDMRKFGKKIWPVFIVVALWFLFSAPYFVRGRIPFPSTYLVSFFSPWSASYGMPVKNNAMPDVITQIYPWKKFTIDVWKNGHVPLWNPNSFSGTVHAGNYQSSVFNPLNSLFVLLPFVDAWSIYILLQPLLAGLFMLLFLREIGCSGKSSLIGSIGFMFSGFLVTWMAYGTLGYAILFLPLLLWSIQRYEKTSSFGAFIIGSVALACSFFSGHFQISLYILGVSFAYVMYETYRSKLWKKGGMLCVMLGIGILLSAPQLLLTYDAFQASVRSANTQMKEIIPWQYIVTFVSADFYGNPVTRNDWFGHYAEWAGYIGIVPLIFSFYGIFFSKYERKIFFLTIGIVSLLLAYASPLSTFLFLWKIPILSTSAASRIIVITSFCLCVLAAFGFEQLFSDWKKGCVKQRVIFFAGVGGVLCLLWIVVYGFQIFSPEYLVVAKRNIVLPSLMCVVTLCCMVIGYYKKPVIMNIAVAMLILLGCFDSYRYASKWMPFDPKEYMYPPQKVILFLQKQIGMNRVFGNMGNEVGSMFRIPLIEGYDAMYQGRYGEFINATSNGIVYVPGRSVVQFDKHGRFALPALQLLSVKYIAHRISDGRNVWTFPFWQYPDEFTSIYRDEHYEVMEYRNAFPKVFLASSFVIKKNSQEIIDTLFQKDFDRKNTVVLEQDPVIEPRDGEGVIEDVKNNDNNQTMKIKVNTSVPKILFRSEVFDPGWHATVDKRSVPIYRADYDFQAISVPAGEHSIEFSYMPQSFRYGFMLSALGVACLLGIAIGCIHKKGKKDNI